MLQIQPSSGTPIYKQIIDQVNRLVISGFLKPGDELPSVRQAAGELEVNPMTISKAYSMLEAAGVLERMRGKGMIIASDQDTSKSIRERLEIIRPILVEATTQAEQLAIPKDILMKLLSDLLEDNNE
ncbi:MAG: GntR family transcriptional regulator [bacterium]|nr:GntR family transcriptional regulator [bacterium]